MTQKLRSGLPLALALACLAAAAKGAEEECDCNKLRMLAAPVCGTDAITYLNACVAKCQEVQVAQDSPCAGLNLKASADGSTEPAAGAAGLNLASINEEAAVGAAELNRYSAQGYRFAAKVYRKGAPVLPQGTAPDAADGDAAAAPSTVMAARITRDGSLYFKSEAFLSNRTTANALTALAGFIPEGLAAAPAAGGKPPRSSRKLRVYGTDDRVEVTSTAYPWSAIGYLDSGCSGALIGPNTVLTAGHCVYDRHTNDWTDLIYFYPNKLSPTKYAAKVEVAAITTYWNNAGPPTQCSDGEWSCHPNSDRYYDFAIIELEEAVGDEQGWLGIGYSCDYNTYFASTAGYPADRTEGHMYYNAGTLEGFRGCEPASDLADNVISSNLDTAGGQSGSSIWETDGSYRIVRAIHVAGGSDGRGYHRAVSDWVYEKVKAVLDAAA